MIKKFFEEHDHLKLGLQHLGMFGGGWKIQVYNTTWDSGFEPIFEHFVTDFDINHLNVDFETIIMTPIITWWEECRKKEEK